MWKESHHLHSNMVKFKSSMEGGKFCHLKIYIPIWLNSNHVHLYRNFFSNRDLHSNMVKFKFRSSCTSFEFANQFTFQYG